MEKKDGGLMRATIIKPCFQNVPEFLKFCTHIAVENVATRAQKYNKLAVLDNTRQNKYSQMIERILGEEASPNVSIQEESL